MVLRIPSQHTGRSWVSIAHRALAVALVQPSAPGCHPSHSTGSDCSGNQAKNEATGDISPLATCNSISDLYRELTGKTPNKNALEEPVMHAGAEFAT